MWTLGICQSTGHKFEYFYHQKSMNIVSVGISYISFIHSLKHTYTHSFLHTKTHRLRHTLLLTVLMRIKNNYVDIWFIKWSVVISTIPDNHISFLFCLPKNLFIVNTVYLLSQSWRLWVLQTLYVCVCVCLCVPLLWDTSWSLLVGFWWNLVKILELMYVW